MSPTSGALKHTEQTGVSSPSFGFIFDGAKLMVLRDSVMLYHQMQEVVFGSTSNINNSTILGKESSKIILKNNCLHLDLYTEKFSKIILIKLNF